MKLLVKKIPETLRWQFIIYSTLLFAIIFYSFFNPIPTDSFSEKVGLGANILDIGDRQFYINYGVDNYGYGNIKGGILYPFILKVITLFTKLFNYGETSLLWNFLTITITSIISLFNLILLDKSAKNIFGNRVAKITNWLYILCPYTIFYALNGGLTVYLVLGTALCTFLVTSSLVFRKDGRGISYLLTNFYLLICVIYISLLRPTGAIFGLCLIIMFNLVSFFKIKKGNIKVKSLDKYLSLSISVLSISFCIYTLLDYLPYISFSIDSFSNEKGSFYGVERQLIKQRLSASSDNLMILKNNIYLALWKVSDFVGGLSDIRDTHRDLTSKPLFPFFIRVFTGIFYIYPVNLLCIAGIFTYKKRIIDSGLVIILISSFVIILPSLIGVGMSRYLIMVYPPLIICSGSILNLIFDEKNKKVNKI